MGRGRRKKTFFGESAFYNNRLFDYYLRRFSELSLSVFKWENLPPGIDERFLELTLYTDGAAVFFKDDILGYLALQVAANGPFDVYRVPVNRRAYAVNGYQVHLDNKDSVIIYNNLLRTPTAPDMELYAYRLYDLDRTIDVNARTQKTPAVIQCSEEERLTLLNLYKEFDGNAPIIMASKNLDLTGLKAIQPTAPYVGGELYQLKTQLWNEALTYLGIANLNIQKKERVVSDEVARSMGGTYASRQSRLAARLEACEQINSMFGLDISCRFRDEEETGTDREDPEEVFINE